LIEFGLDPVASHLFILYWGMMSYITPPVALAAVAAAVIARSDSMTTAFLAMRLGSIKFILPFIIVVTPSLIMRGAPEDIVVSISACVLAVLFMAGGFEGYLYGVGKASWPTRVALLVAAASFIYPDKVSYMVGAVLVIATYGVNIIRVRAQR
jgi:TRAP-type uncharacterized transport system fused permease subunit